MSRAAKAIVVSVVSASTFAWAIARDNFGAIEIVGPPPPRGPRMIEATLDDYPIRIYRDAYDRMLEGPGPDHMQWNNAAAVCYVRMLAGPAALVMDMGEEGLISVGWFPRVQPGNPCLTDFELHDVDLRVTDFALTPAGGCEKSTIRMFRIEDFRLREVSTAVLFPSANEVFAAVAAYDVKSQPVPLISPLEAPDAPADVVTETWRETGRWRGGIY